MMAAGTDGREWLFHREAWIVGPKMCGLFYHGAWRVGPRMLGLDYLEENPEPERTSEE